MTADHVAPELEPFAAVARAIEAHLLDDSPLNRLSMYAGNDLHIQSGYLRDIAKGLRLLLHYLVERDALGSRR